MKQKTDHPPGEVWCVISSATAFWVYLFEADMDNYYNIQLNRETKEPLYLQVYRALKQSIVSGFLVSNDKLPPIRELAGLLHVNNSTIVQAYKELELEGLVIKKVGSGTYVFTEGEHVDFLAQSFSRGEGGFMQKPTKEDALRINFASGTPSDDYFPVDDFKRLINEVLDRDGTKAFGYEDPQGYQPLREALSLWCRGKGISAHEEDIQVISGAQQGLDIVTKALLTHQDTVIVEAPTYTGAIALLKSKGVHIVELPIERGRVNMIRLKELVITHRPKLFFTMTNLQNPTGYSYRIEEKAQILELAKRYSFIVVEDDYASELSYWGEKRTTLKSLDAEAPIVYIKSFSKVVLPGLRLGFMIVPHYLKERMTAVKQQSDIATSGLIQRSFDLYLRKGLLEEHTCQVVESYKQRYIILKEAVQTFFPKQVYCAFPEGGANLWCELPGHHSARALYLLAKSKGILISSGDVFYATRLDSNAFRLSVSDIDIQEIAVGIRLLAQVLEEFIHL